MYFKLNRRIDRFTDAARIVDLSLELQVSLYR